MSFVYSAQMYGAGKTRIGSEFVNQTRVLLEEEDTFHQYCPEHLKSRLPELLPIVEAFSGQRYDLTKAASFYSAA